MEFLELHDLGDKVDAAVEVREPGFTIRWEKPQPSPTYTSSSYLRNIFGTFVRPSGHARSWASFGDIVTFSDPELKLTIEDILGAKNRQVLSYPPPWIL